MFMNYRHKKKTIDKMDKIKGWYKILDILLWSGFVSFASFENIRCSNSDAVKRPPESDRSFERGPHGVVTYKIEKRA